MRELTIAERHFYALSVELADGFWRLTLDYLESEANREASPEQVDRMLDDLEAEQRKILDGYVERTANQHRLERKLQDFHAERERAKDLEEGLNDDP